MPRNLACPVNAANSIMRMIGEFEFIPEDNRQQATKSIEATQAVLTPLVGA